MMLQQLYKGSFFGLLLGDAAAVMQRIPLFFLLLLGDAAAGMQKLPFFYCYWEMLQQSCKGFLFLDYYLEMLQQSFEGLHFFALS